MIAAIDGREYWLDDNCHECGHRFVAGDLRVVKGQHDVCTTCFVAHRPDPTLHRWDMDAPPVVLRDDDGAPLRPCPGDWPEDDDAE